MHRSQDADLSSASTTSMDGNHFNSAGQMPKVLSGEHTGKENSKGGAPHSRHSKSDSGKARGLR